jgi:hypothetical protein
MLYALCYIAGLIAGFICCWVVARRLLNPLKDMLEAAGYKVGED